MSTMSVLLWLNFKSLHSIQRQITYRIFNPLLDRREITCFKSNVKLTIDITSIQKIIDVIVLNNINDRRCVHKVQYRSKNKPLRHANRHAALT